MSTEPASISITGTLSRPRAEVVEAIRAAGARFVEKPSPLTDYLVASQLNTGKARSAAKHGVQIISEADLDAMLASGSVQPRPDKRAYVRPNNFPDFDLSQLSGEPRPAFVEYEDASGLVTTRHLMVAGELTGSNGRRYLAVYDLGEFKTLLPERVRSNEYLD